MFLFVLGRLGFSLVASLLGLLACWLVGLVGRSVWVLPGRHYIIERLGIGGTILLFTVRRLCSCVFCRPRKQSSFSQKT
ncbi:hypothetical protein HOY80DRAFT_722143 [Tuber brumale]|nr:hypothetical protein HOY80DRAFT_722143 [Tuber brumale]